MKIQKIVFVIIFLLQILLCFQIINCQTDFKKTISFLASPEMEGRYPGTKADSIVQTFIVDNFKTDNLTTLPSLNSFYQKFSLPTLYSFEGNFLLKKGGVKLKFLSMKKIFILVIKVKKIR